MSNNRYGVILFNRIYVVEAESVDKLPLQFTRMCYIIMDLTDRQVIKTRYHESVLDPSTLFPLFDFYGTTSLEQIHADVKYL